MANFTEIANPDPEDVQAYEDRLTSSRDLKNSLDTAREEGREEGIKQGIEIVLHVFDLIRQGTTVPQMSSQTGMSEARLRRIIELIRKR